MDALLEASLASQLPEVPGGYDNREFPLPGRTLQLWVPSQPDLLLDDPDVLEWHRRDDYMPYWAYVWPAAVPLCRALLARSWSPGMHAMEVGCGTGVTGLTALACGMTVDVTDYDASSVELARLNALRNGLGAQLHAYPFDWRNPPPRPYDLLLGSDVVYEARNHAPLLELTARGLAPGGRAWFGDGGRALGAEFLERARADGRFEVHIWNEQLQPLSQHRCGEFCLIELLLRD